MFTGMGSIYYLTTLFFSPNFSTNLIKEYYFSLQRTKVSQ